MSQDITSVSRASDVRLQTAPRTSEVRLQSDAYLQNEARHPTTTRSSQPASAPPAPRTLAMPPERRSAASDPWPAIKTDIEQLLPISHGVRSLPRPPRMPNFDSAPQPVAATRRLPWASIAVFAVVMAGSVTTLVRYSDRTDSLPLAQAEPTVLPSQEAVPRLVVASSAEHRRDAIRHIENAFAGDAARIGEALLDEAERALEADDERLAEALFARAYELEHDTGRATFGLARVRLAQGNLEGAEGWVQIAIRAYPRRAAYHALYASVLERWGRLHEAQLERSLARSLTNASATSEP